MSPATVSTWDLYGSMSARTGIEDCHQTICSSTFGKVDHLCSNTYDSNLSFDLVIYIYIYMSVHMNQEFQGRGGGNESELFIVCSCLKRPL